MKLTDKIKAKAEMPKTKEDPTQTTEQKRIILDDEKLDQVAGGAWVTTDLGPRACNTNGGIE